MRLVFVSSTFKDMQAERDALHTRVTPLINSYLAEFGENVGFGDLRWGVNTSEMNSDESSKKVLKVCLDRIDDCRPYMIVFIGERYGWIPSKDILETACKLKNIPMNNLDCSVTELEIEYGALLNPDFAGHILFYFREEFDKSKMTEEERKIYESESPLHKKKIEDLKEKILKLYPNHVRYYKPYFDEETRSLKGLEPVMETITQDLKNIFKIDIKAEESIPWQQKAIRNAKLFFENKGKYFYPRKELVDSLTEEKKPMIEYIIGDEGTGKSSLLAAKYLKYQQQESNYSIALGIRCDRNLLSIEKIIDVLCFYLEDVLNVKIIDARNNIEKLKRLFDIIEEKNDKKLHIFLMNIEYLDLWFLRSISQLQPYYKRYYNNIFFHIQMINKLPKIFIKPYFSYTKIIELSNFDKEDLEGVIDVLCQKKNKELSKKVKNEIVKIDAATNPLYLSLLVERLCMLDEEDFNKIRALGDGMEAIDKYLIDIVNKSGSNLKEITRNLLNELIERINPLFIKRLIKIFTHKNVLNQYAIEKLFIHKNYEFSELEYTLFVKTFPSLIKLESKDNLYVFTSNKIKSIAKEFIDEIYIEDISREVYNWIYTMDFNDKFRNKALLMFLFETRDIDLIYKNIIEIDNKYKQLNSMSKSDEKTLLNNSVKAYFISMEKIMSDLIIGTDKEYAMDIIKKILDGAIENDYSIPTILNLIGNLDGVYDKDEQDAVLEAKLEIMRYCLKLDPQGKNRFLSSTGFLLSMACLDISYSDEVIREGIKNVQNYHRLNIKDYFINSMDNIGVVNVINNIQSTMYQLLKEEDEEYISDGINHLMRSMISNIYNNITKKAKDKNYIKSVKEGKVNESLLNFNNMLYSYVKVVYSICQYYISNKKQGNKSIICAFKEFDNMMLNSTDSNFVWISQYIMPYRKYYIRALNETIKKDKKLLKEVKDTISIQERLCADICNSTNQHFLFNILDSNIYIFKNILNSRCKKEKNLQPQDIECFYKETLEMYRASLHRINVDKEQAMKYIDFLTCINTKCLTKEEFYQCIKEFLDVYIKEFGCSVEEGKAFLDNSDIYEFLYLYDITYKEYQEKFQIMVNEYNV